MTGNEPNRRKRLLRLAGTVLLTLALVGLGLWLMHYAVSHMFQPMELEVEADEQPAP
jgi:hypothetical protein